MKTQDTFLEKENRLIKRFSLFLLHDRITAEVIHFVVQTFHLSHDAFVCFATSVEICTMVGRNPAGNIMLLNSHGDK